MYTTYHASSPKNMVQQWERLGSILVPAAIASAVTVAVYHYYHVSKMRKQCSDSKTAAIYEARNRRIYSACQKYGKRLHDAAVVGKRLILDVDHGLGFCYNAKVGGTRTQRLDYFIHVTVLGWRNHLVLPFPQTDKSKRNKGRPRDQEKNALRSI